MSKATSKFDTLLVANRGEIACRVMRTARRLGIKTVAVYSDADASARHVREADEAVRLGPAAARESYLNIEAVIAAARQSGSTAVHPGYGFLSENGRFVEALEAAGITFVGPPASAIAAMGDKSAAKARMANAGVPLVPGYHGDDQGDDTLLAEANRIGYPVMLKASAGGGGKGMRVVEREADFQAALESCRRESKASFSDDRMLIEKYLVKPRHVEVQVFCDRFGAGVYLFERDCSVQRRHQKVLEEAPAPHMTEALRAAMGEAAVRAAKEIGYVGAGTVEFLLDVDGAFYFMEMNTRLQVEHPVTEMVTGLDLVEWQLRVAMNEPLPCAQSELTLNGHSFEARLYAEDPANEFLPATGTLTRFSLDVEGAGLESAQVRLDSGVESGDIVSMHYDPMLAKLITHGTDRDAALATLNRALAALDVQGVVTNRAFLQRLAGHPAFKAAELDTGFIVRHHDDLFRQNEPTPQAYARAALVAIETLAKNAGRQDVSPWAHSDGFRLNAPHKVRIALADKREESETVVVEATRTRAQAGWTLRVQNERFEGSLSRLAGDAVAVTLNGHRRRFQAQLEEDNLVLSDSAGETRLVWQRLDALNHAAIEAAASLTAPMHGTVVALLVEPGAPVEKGMPLMVMEAMKMEHTLSAPADGTVEQFRFAVGDSVGQGDVLLDFAATDEGA
ncbi:acetyl/propionyl/methylcrotonyl-CoA carboxylase subunit alpha [Halomonas sp. PAMB 3264]|uniref:acetyl/propionyl/methylcrotonyl-CoA carboxylase subunit alpha n=1 Tax=Halomonas sp. PAMB 3264 TaxID=3075222 RepID=UPI0028973756|nr:acetyl/propionyl/methylcrotonyl-CoA carboxylase subunit alpha [Halomonas sp. PAMB 3264]WNL40772.1 acetyl/propionyl/methylcrotonyl-CoA carboxylase subunit alpha [Halomonas sp. PAMB 3264]